MNLTLNKYMETGKKKQEFNTLIDTHCSCKEVNAFLKIHLLNYLQGLRYAVSVSEHRNVFSNIHQSPLTIKRRRIEHRI